VQTPQEVGLLQKSDPVQLGHAVREQRILITANHDDFEDLHDLILVADGHHFGVLVVRQDNDPTRDMTLRAIVRAVANVAATMPDLTNIFQVLNHWRSS
jgi:hypothetical protein